MQRVIKKNFIPFKKFTQKVFFYHSRFSTEQRMRFVGKLFNLKIPSERLIWARVSLKDL
jgi:hypothetical protein